VALNPPFYAIGPHFAIDLPGAHAVFTTRRGGFSTGAYASLNLGRLTDDEPDAVARNRAAVQTDVGGRLRFVRQVHGACVLTITSGARERSELPEADGQATALRAVAPAVLTADCLPIALAGSGAVAVLHAGWRGLAAGVLAEGVSAVRELGARGPLAAAIGPGAGPCCYEVGAEVHEQFIELPDAVHRGRSLDLKRIARHELVRAGVAEVHDIELCTICSVERSSDPEPLFYSHRRDRGVTGRQAGIAWLSCSQA
jgi:polyphenol oxidase